MNHSKKTYEKLGQGLTQEQHDLVYSQAYQDGHHNGESEIEIHYDNLADLARALLQTR